ncbi:MAG: hypothetical protein Q7S11_03390 [bacterium]|nr:hypothetical protein [bacterium]
MLLKKEVVSVAIAVTIACTALVPSFVSAGPVNTELAGNPTAVMAEIEAMNLIPLSDADAAEMRGEALPWVVVYGMYYTGVALGIAWYKLAPYALSCANNCSNLYDLGSAYYDAIRTLTSTNPGKRNCFYSGTANSTPMYCS